MSKPTPKQKEEQTAKALVVKKERHEHIMTKISTLEKDHGLCFPKNYNYTNAIQSAWLMLADVEDRDGNKALAVCTPESIANFMLNMVTQGLSVAKKQCYPIVYGNQLTMFRSYFGSLAIVKRIKGVMNAYAEVIRQGQEFKIGTINGVKYVEKHDISFDTLDNAIVGAYCVIETDVGTFTEIMTMKQIQLSWNASKTQQSVHKTHPDQMAMRTVINRACKTFINTSDDSDLLVSSFNETTENEFDNGAEQNAKSAIAEKANSQEFTAEYNIEQTEDPQPEQQPEQQPTTGDQQLEVDY